MVPNQGKPLPVRSAEVGELHLLSGQLCGGQRSGPSRENKAGSGVFLNKDPDE